MHATYTRLFTDASGVSRFEDIEVELRPGFAVPAAEPLSVADFVLTERCSWIGGTPDWKGDAVHPVPRRTLCVVATGQIEITVGSGETRLFGPGSVILAEDTTGTGHSTRITGSGNSHSLFFSLPEA